MAYSNPKLPKKIRLNESLYREPNRVYYITIDSNFKRPYFKRHELNLAIIDCLKKERVRLNCKVFVYCLMPNHLHFLTSPNSEVISIIDFVNQFKGKSTKVAWDYNIQGSLWQRRFYDHIVRKSEDLIEIANYILQNPVRKGLVENYEQYPYCGSIDELPI